MNIRQEIISLTKKTSKELRKMYETETGSKAPPYRREYFIKWLAYRMQEKVYGGLSEKATKQLDYFTEEMKKGRKIVSENSSLIAGTSINRLFESNDTNYCCSNCTYSRRNCITHSNGKKTC